MEMLMKSWQVPSRLKTYGYSYDPLITVLAIAQRINFIESY